MHPSRNAVLVLLCLLVASPCHSQNQPTASPAPAAPAIPDSPAGLQSQLEAIVKIKNKKELKRREQLIRDLRIQDPDAWFASAFGNDDGEKLAATYKSSWEDFEDHFTNIIANLAEAGQTHVSVKEISLSATAAVAGQNEFAATDAKPAIVFYSASATKGSMPGSGLPGIYTYDQGAFRLVNWQTLYELSYMKPMRIRIGGNVAAAKLVKKVDPIYPALAGNNMVSGTVVLHVVLTRDGQVSQVNLVSGPSELVDASMNAVRQWRYQPTLLNGDPVEVDTMVSVQFKLK